jgi:hypothetical protein
MYPRKAFWNTTFGLVLSLPLLPGSIHAASAPRDLEPGRAIAAQTGDSFQLVNRAIGAKWAVAAGKVNSLAVMDRLHGTELRVDAPFAILLKNGSVYDAGNLNVTGQIARLELAARPDASRFADRLRGEEFDVPLESSDHSLRVVWSLILLDGSSYLRQTLTIAAVGKDVPISRVELVDLPLPGAHVIGSTDGSPIASSIPCRKAKLLETGQPPGWIATCPSGQVSRSLTHR